MEEVFIEPRWGYFSPFQLTKMGLACFSISGRRVVPSWRGRCFVNCFVANPFSNSTWSCVFSGPLIFGMAKKYWFGCHFLGCTLRLVRGRPRHSSTVHSLAWGEDMYGNVATEEHFARNAKPDMVLHCSLCLGEQHETNQIAWAKTAWARMTTNHTYIIYGRMSFGMSQAFPTSLRPHDS